MLSVKKLIYKMLSLSMVVEEVSSGDWTYRKWSNGTSECWLNYTEPTAQTFSPSGNVFYRVISGLNFPSGLFISTPVVMISVYFANVGGCAISSVSSTSCAVTVLSAVASARAVTVKLYAKGRWK